MSERETRLERLAVLRQQGRDPYAVTSFDRTHSTKDIAEQFEALEGTTVRIAGRLVARRGHGKATFLDISDASGRLQVFGALDALGEERYADLDLLDLADFVGIVGEVFRTRRGEISVRATEVHLLTKALSALPEKFHGLRDVEVRFRKRYLDLVANPEVRELFFQRGRMVEAIRGLFHERGFLEVETPMMQPIAGGAAARPFVTHHNTLDLELFLRVAPELYLKRLIVGGFERVFEINRNFRNEGMDRNHNPEFTMLEAYQAYTDYRGMMELVEAIVTRAAEAVCGGHRITRGGQEIDLTPPWRRLSIPDALAEYTGVTMEQLDSDASATRIAKEKGLNLDGTPTVGSVVKKLLDEYVEPHLIQPTHLTDHPVVISPLAKRRADRPELTERFETFVAGMELANAFSELNDPLDQRQRFEQQAAEKASGDEETHPFDEDFLEALELGLPPTGGMGLGIDRLLMLLTDTHTIREVILFPLMRPEE
jgi:lysyl-tRNA synthetase, class II